MATTILTFGTDSTLLGLDYAPLDSHQVATRASFEAFPTVSYAGTGAVAPGNVFTVQLYISALFFGSVNGVFYVTSLGGGSASDGVSAIGASGSTSYAQGVTVTYTSSSSADLTTFLKGIYVGDTSATSVSETFKLNLTLDDGANTPSAYAMFYDVVCFLRGTGIATDQGDVAVEDLRIGDMVRTADGSLQPVKFIGTQAFEAEFIAATPSQRPVLIRKDAIGENLPARDLYVSAMHSLFIDDVLVPAVALVNGSSIIRADVPGAVEYFHIELDGHHVILAEGLPAESFIDDQSRAVFDNAFEYEALYGEGARIQPIAPRIEEGYTVAAIRRRIAERAGIEAPAATAPVAIRGHVESLDDGQLAGWVLDEANTDVAVELDVLVDGELVGRALANRYRTDLDHAGLAGGRCGFTMALPAAAGSLDQVEVKVAATGASLRKAATATASV